MAKDVIRSARADLLATKKLLKGATKSEYKYTQDVLGSIYGNLGSTLGGGRAALTTEQKRLTGALSALKQNQSRVSGQQERNTRNVVSRLYGTSTAGAVKPALDTVAVTGAAGTKAVGGQVAAGGILARGNEAAYTTLEQGARAAEAGAQGMLADALTYRAKDDARLIAEQQLAITQQRFTMQQMRLQNKLDLKNYEKKLALEDEAAGTGGQISAIAGLAAGAAPELWNEFMQWRNADGTVVADQASVHQNDQGQWVDSEDNLVHAPTAGEAVNAVVLNGAIQDTNEIALIAAIARAMHSAGAGHVAGAYSAEPEDLTKAITQRLSFMYPDAGKYLSTIENIVGASFAEELIRGGYVTTPTALPEGSDAWPWWQKIVGYGAGGLRTYYNPSGAMVEEQFGYRKA